MENTKIKQVRDNVYELKLTVTKGKLLALVHALENYNTPVAQDLLSLLEETKKIARS